MNERRLSLTPTMLLVTALLFAVYVYGYIEQIDKNYESVSTYGAVQVSSR